MINPVQTAFDVTTAQTGLIFSFAIVSFTTAILLSPAVMTHKPPPFRLAVFGALAMVSITFSALANSYVAFVILFSGGFGAMSGALYITTLGAAANSTHHATMTPIMVASFGAGGAVFGPLWRLTDDWGWGLSGLFLLSAGLCFACALLVMTHRRGGENNKAHPVDAPQAMLATKHARMCFCLIWLTFAFGSFGGLMVLGLAAKMMDGAALPIGVTTLSLAGIAIGNTLGRLSIAGVFRISGIWVCLATSIGLSMIGLICATIEQALPLGLILIAVGYGMTASSIPVLTRQTFGVRRFQRAFAFMMTAWGTAGFIAPWVGGYIFDISGRFDAALWVAVVMMALCALTVWCLKRVSTGDVG